MDIPKQIEPFGITQLSVGACAQFHEMVNTYISQATPEALGIEAWAPDYRKATDQLAAIVPRQREWVVTQHWKKARRAGQCHRCHQPGRADFPEIGCARAAAGSRPVEPGVAGLLRHR